MDSDMWDAVVVGGGASGLVAAIAAAEMGDRVLILERMDRIGKKILATGNGRCNILNTGALRYPGGLPLACDVLSKASGKFQWNWWLRHGLKLREEDDGRAYPVSSHASSVLDVLRMWLRQLSVRVETGEKVIGLGRRSTGFLVQSCRQDGTVQEWFGKRVLICTGGCAQPKLGSDGSGYSLASSFGHQIVRPVPALSPIETEKKPIAGLLGIRVKAGVKVTRHGKQICQENGELLFTDYGISGICAMQCACAVGVPESTLEICLLNGMGFSDRHELSEELLRRTKWFARLPLEEILTGLCVHALALAVFRCAGIKWQGRFMGSMNEKELNQLVSVCSSFPVEVKGVRGFDFCQVTAGGIFWNQVDSSTMESVLVKGLYLTGEVLDVDGDCGGFNLMFAFGSGLLAGYRNRIKWDEEN